VIELAVRVRPWRAVLAAVLCVAALARADAASLSLAVRDDAGMPLEHAAVALVPVAGAAPQRPARAEIVQQDKRFIPLVSTVPTGSAVEFPNLDTVRHHVYSFSPAKSFELKLYIGKPAAPVVFDKPGVVVMGCNIHDHMVAYVLVSDTPWVGVSDAAGAARLGPLPDGEYTLEYWHPRWAGVSVEPQRRSLRVQGEIRQVLTIGARP